jgi:leader peptidase (prepilin peptidase)/N-methyltransferase
MLHATFDSNNWARVPFHFWSVVFFALGCIVGSFLNVCIHRMPRGESIVSPPSHCPHCRYSIPWYLNIPLVTWLWLRGRCRNCGAPIAPRYFLVELLTGLTFMASWLAFGRSSAALALVYCVFLAGLIAATFIDFEHFIIPDEITLGGVMAGVVFSFVLPRLQGRATMVESVLQSLLGAGVGAGVVYAVLRLGKWLFGRHRLALPPGSRAVFGENELHLPDRVIPYEELFYRRSDMVVVHAQTVELVDRCYWGVEVRLKPECLQIGDVELNPEEVPHLEVVSEEILLPREAMGLGDVKFMAGIGAFLGWPAVIFSLMVSSMIGAVVGVLLIVLRKREWSSRLPYGPYIALAAVIWIFWGTQILAAFFGG